jgi:hypothetical protein
MKSRCLVVVSALLTVVFPAAGRTQPLVVGGGSAAGGSWPSIVAISTTASFCGGTLVDRGWVVTAAHCTYQPGSVVPLVPADITVFAGRTNLTISTPESQTVAVSQIVRHPDYVHGTGFRNDLALLRLATPMTLGTLVATSDLPPQTEPIVGPGKVAGWGATFEGSTTPPDALQEATVGLLGDADCGAYGTNFAPGLMTCAGSLAGGVDTCQGDSGGPLVAPGMAGSPLIGITSFGNGCARPGTPGVYTKTSAFRSFVYSTIGLAVPGAPSAVSVTRTSGSATVSWTPPTQPGAKPISGYEIIARGPSNIVTAVASATATSGAVSGLLPNNRYSFGVVASSVVGGSPEVAALPPSSASAPSAPSKARVGLSLSGSTGTWQDTVDPLVVQWQSCDAVGGGCVDVAGAAASTYTPSLADLRRTLRISVTATNASGRTTEVSLPSSLVLPAFTVTKTRAPQVTIGRNNNAVVSLGLTVEARSRISIRVLDPRGRLRPLTRRDSRIDGRVPAAGANRLRGQVKNTSVHTVRVAFAVRRGGTPKTVRIVVVATGVQGERTEATFKVRVPL